ncbi:unnamed protein product [Tenebrio molitor]|jgi:hypothetical protein|nr:unnamed protein product [Tenebrio molitor]
MLQNVRDVCYCRKKRCPFVTLNRIQLGVTWHTLTFEKKVRGDCAHLRGDVQKPYAPKCGQGKTKIDLFRDFFTKIAYV